MLLRTPGYMGRVRYIVGQLQAPTRRAVMRRGVLRRREAEARVQLADDAVFCGRYVIRAERPYTHPKRSLDRDIHRFPFQLPAEHPTAHDPGIDLHPIGLLRVRTQNHRTHKTIVAEPVDEAELQRETSIGGE